MHDASQHGYIRDGNLNRLFDDVALAGSVLRFAAVEASHQYLQLLR